ncbi:urea transporter [Chryseobacterium koreense]|uniref:urea transporter n=1 Tax=Chryseobacterium koreense TaxID=232216 RepID=UPI0026EDB075|nr:urea transporter [Chryseobacterium koreense]
MTHPRKCDKVNAKVSFSESVILIGIAQLMLLENSLTDLLFLMGLFYGSTTMGFAVLLARASGR